MSTNIILTEKIHVHVHVHGNMHVFVLPCTCTMYMYMYFMYYRETGMYMYLYILILHLVITFYIAWTHYSLTWGISTHKVNVHVMVSGVLILVCSPHFLVRACGRAEGTSCEEATTRG